MNTRDPRKPSEPVGSSRGLLRPWWVVAIALFAVIVVVLGGGFFLDRHFRPRIDTEPAPSPSVALASTPMAVAKPSPVVPATATGIAATPSPTAAVALATSSSSPSTTGTPSTPLASQVEAAYFHYWDVYSNALYTLDTSRLPEVMAGTELDQARQMIESLRSQNQAMKVDVERHYQIVDLTPTRAAIEDHYLNKSYLVNATTKRPLQTPGNGEVVAIACQLELQGGSWKVVHVTQIQ